MKELKASYDRATNSIARLRNEFDSFQTYCRSGPVARDTVDRDRATRLVILAATLESFVREAIGQAYLLASTCDKLISEINESFIVVALASHFEALRQLRDSEKTWKSRLELVDYIRSLAMPLSVVRHDLASSPVAGGATIEPWHIDIIVRLFDAKVPALSLMHRVRVKELSRLRNNIAHGNVESLSVGRQLTPLDIHGYFDTVLVTTNYIFDVVLDWSSLHFSDNESDHQ